LDGLNAFTVSIWFRPDAKATPRAEQFLFRVTGDPSDVTDQTSEGIRLGLFVGADSSQTTNLRVQYAKVGTDKPDASFSQSLSYVD
jgi:hypothetical protein